MSDSPSTSDVCASSGVRTFSWKNALQEQVGAFVLSSPLTLTRWGVDLTVCP